MSIKSIKKSEQFSDDSERSQEELLEEETKNQQTIDIFIQSDKNWS